MNSRIFFFLFVFALISCNDDDEGGFPSATGIEGRILTQDEFQRPLYEERDSVELQIAVGFNNFEVNGDNVGQWKLSGAPVGTYNITVVKDGFGPVERRNIRISTVTPEYPVFDGFQKLPTFVITEKPNTQFQNVELNLTFDTQVVEMIEDTIWNLNMSALMSPAPPPTGEPKGYRVFWGTDQLLSPENYLFQAHYTSLNENIELNFNDPIFDALGIKSGDMIFAQFYGDSNFNFEYTTEDGRLIFPNISDNPSSVFSVVLP
ncbi:MAG: carboxypeptidase-like regulatory domain-containing protein [Flavobacteriales bacterium]|nr:carboxypeptidase-like regulatory domain-containing protein [Flavobacteriales bacterium]